MRKLLLGFVTIILSDSLGCSNASPNYNSHDTSTAPERQLNSEDAGIRLEKVLVGNKPIVDLTYEQVLRYWSNLAEVKKRKVHFPTTTEFSGLENHAVISRVVYKTDMVLFSYME